MFFDDTDIEGMLAEKKPTLDPAVLLSRLVTSAPVRGHRRHSVTVTGALGRRYELNLRQNVLDPYDFSVILSHRPSADRSFNVRRHNGTSHAHRNPIEGTTFRNVCHVHVATERYQVRGAEPETFATETTDFVDIAGALRQMLKVASFAPPAQTSLDVP